MMKNIVFFLKGGREILFLVIGVSLLNIMYYVVDMNGNQCLLILEEGIYNVYMNIVGILFIDEYISYIVFWKMVLKNVNIKVLKIFYIGKMCLEEYVYGMVEIGQIKGVDGLILYICLIKLFNFDLEKKYLVLVYVYGGLYV